VPSWLSELVFPSHSFIDLPFSKVVLMEAFTAGDGGGSATVEQVSVTGVVGLLIDVLPGQPFVHVPPVSPVLSPQV